MFQSCQYPRSLNSRVIQGLPTFVSRFYLFLYRINIDLSDPDKDRNNYLSDFVDTLSLSNLINRKTCHKNLSGTTIDIMLTNRPNRFQKTSTVITGLSDFYKMIISCLKTTFKKFHPKKLFSEIIKSLVNKIFYTISINK